MVNVVQDLIPNDHGYRLPHGNPAIVQQVVPSSRGRVANPDRGSCRQAEVPSEVSLRDRWIQTKLPQQCLFLRFTLGKLNAVSVFIIILTIAQAKHIVIFDTLIKQSTPGEVEAILGAFISRNVGCLLATDQLSLAHELGHWYYMHPAKLLLVSQVHIFTILALFPAFMHAPQVLRAFDFPEKVAVTPPTIIAFLLFQVTPLLNLF